MQFYVFNPAEDKPRFKHDTFEGADAEAKRLADVCPGERFEVLQVVGTRKRVKSIDHLILLAALKRSIHSPFGGKRKSIPAAMMVNQSAARVHRLLQSGLYVYEKGLT